MNREEIIKDIDELSTIVASWDAQELPSEIERDIVLCKLSTIYQQIKFGAAAASTAQSKVSSYQEPQEIIQPQSVESQPMQSIVPEDIFIVESQNFEPIEESPAIETQIPTPQAEVSIESESDVEVDVEPTTIDIDLEQHVVEPTHTQNLFDDDMPLPTAKRKVDRSVILSLYGDDSSPRVEIVDNHHQTPIESDDDELQIVASKSDGALLGEAFTPAQSVADVISSAGVAPDMASHISTNATKDLRGAIGLNDKFLMIRDVFDGDNAQYEIAVDALERFDSLDDAMLFLYENYNQNPNSDGAKLLVELLTRKLS